MHHDEDAPPALSRRRSGKTEGEFRRLARKLSRRLDVWRQFEKVAKALAVRRVRTIILSPDEWGAPDAHLTNTNDLLQLWNNDAGSGYDGGFNTTQNHIFPGL